MNRNSRPCVAHDVTDRTRLCPVLSNIEELSVPAMIHKNPQKPDRRNNRTSPKKDFLPNFFWVLGDVPNSC